MQIEFPDDLELDCRIAHVIVQGIPALRGKGYPDSLTPQEWDKILDEIEEGFQNYLDSYFGPDWDTKKLDRALDLLQEWFLSLWW